MSLTALDQLRAQIAAVHPVRPLGRIRHVNGQRVTIAGLDHEARLGDEVLCHRPAGPLRAEIAALTADGIEAMPYDASEGLSLGQVVELVGPATIAPCDGWLGRIVDPFGQPLDNAPLRGGSPLSLRRMPPPAGQRAGFGPRMATGHVALDTVLPIAEGQRMGIFAGAGVGKSRLLGDLACEMDADIVVAALVGERGREVSAFARDVLGGGLGRSVIVAATSDRPANVRRRAIPAALTVAEHFRDKGARVLFLCDSLTRHADAYRDVAGDQSAGLPVGLVGEIAACLERAGPGMTGQRAITGIFSVLVAGTDMDEPVADAVRGLLDGHIVLSRDIAEAGRYPAIDVLASVSRSLPDVATSAENKMIRKTCQFMEVIARNELMVRSGLYETGSDPLLDEALRRRQQIESVLCARSASPRESFDLLAKTLE